MAQAQPEWSGELSTDPDTRDAEIAAMLVFERAKEHNGVPWTRSVVRYSAAELLEWFDVDDPDGSIATRVDKLAVEGTVTVTLAGKAPNTL